MTTPRDKPVQYHSPAARAATITPSDSADLPNPCHAIYVGGAGNIALTTEGGDDVTFIAVVAGSIIPVRSRRVKATGTSATNLVAMWSD